jgi:Fungal Zn(2)-Cys(6) binuclear cluster domain/Aflatoxin regulatory protein
MSGTQRASKPRHYKLRESCDFCFFAKVKCTKTRPICSRCLTFGSDCKYSPSSRAGRPKSDGSRGCQSNISRRMSLPEHSKTSTRAYTTPSMNIDDKHSYSYRQDTDWPPTPSSIDGRMHRHSISSTTMPIPANETLAEPEDLAINGRLFDPSFSWTNTPRVDMASGSSGAISPAPWFECDTNFNTSLALGLSPDPDVYLFNTMTAKSPTCNCFNTCLQALQALHSNTTSTTSVPSFDVALTVNRKAVEGCAMMLNCPNCLSQSGSSTTTMLLGTIIGMIMTIYQDASKNYFGLTSGVSSQPLPLTIGTYRVAGEDGRWLEMEIIMRELTKLKVLFAKFQGTGEWEEDGDVGMHSAVKNHLCQSLHLTFEVLNRQKNCT